MSCRSTQYSGTKSNGTSWSNWAELAGGPVDTFYEPGSLGNIVGVVQDAEANGKHVRVVGSGWAFDDIAYSPGVMVSLVRLQRVLGYVTDPDAGALLSPTLPNGRRLVHVEAGMKVATLNAQLAARGLAMPTLGGSNGQSIVGAFSTSTHGADFFEPPFCDLVHEDERPRAESGGRQRPMIVRPVAATAWPIARNVAPSPPRNSFWVCNSHRAPVPVPIRKALSILPTSCTATM
jgi:hypothetical protein